jgi:hypothetical protein
MKCWGESIRPPQAPPKDKASQGLQRIKPPRAPPKEGFKVVYELNQSL